MTTSVRSEATRSIVAVNGVDRLAIHSDGSVELLTPAANPSGNKLMTASQIPFSKVYESPEQTMTVSVSTAYTLTHGLERAPMLIQYMYICKVAGFGYSVGDTILPTTVYDSSASANAYGWSTTISDTTIYVRQGLHPLTLMDKSTGAVIAYASIVANFKLIVRAWA